MTIGYQPPQASENALTIYIAIGTHRQIGGAVLPLSQNAEGSTVFLPFKGDLLLSAEVRTGQIVGFIRRWERWRWSEREEVHAVEITEEKGEFVFRIPRNLLGEAEKVDCAIYAKDPAANNGWGWFWGCSDRSVASGIGDKYIPHYHELHLNPERGPVATQHSRHGSDKSRVRIYQLFVRLFGNTNETRRQNGTLVENGVGHFADINEAALNSLQEMGFTHVWLTGVSRAGYRHRLFRGRSTGGRHRLIKGTRNTNICTRRSSTSIGMCTMSTISTYMGPMIRRASRIRTGIATFACGTAIRTIRISITATGTLTDG